MLYSVVYRGVFSKRDSSDMIHYSLKSPDSGRSVTQLEPTTATALATIL